MGLERLVCSPSQREQLGLYRACDFLEGCVDTEAVGGGWVRPWRVSRRQLRVLGSCMAWHPGYFKRMARATAGVCVHFLTDASECALALRLDPLRDAKAGDAGTLVGAVVDGRPVERVSLRELPEGVPGVEGSGPCTLAVVPLAAPAEVPEPGMVPLPGFGREHEVALWLPYQRGCTVRELWCDGTYAKPASPRKPLLVLGDSLGQGFGAATFAQAWPALLAQRLGMELLDQSVSGQVFQPDFALALAGQPEPGLVVVELGSNYRFEACEASRMEGEVTGFLSNLAELWPQVPTLVLTPTAYDAQRTPTHRGSCFAQVPRALRRAAASHENQRLVEGPSVLGDAGLLLDSVHPGPEGHLQMASRLEVVVHECGQTPESLERDSQALLSKAPACTFGMAEALRRGIARPLYASGNALLLGLPGNGRALYARDRSEGRAVLGALCSTANVCRIFACGEGAFEDAADVLGFDVVEPLVLLAWHKRERVEVPARLASAIRPLDASAREALEGWAEPLHGVEAAEVRDLLERGALLGAFEKGELVGFVGELPDGSVSMPQVLGGHKNRGWAAALVAAKANEFLARGLLPWILVYPYDKSLLKRLQGWGFEASPATEQCVASPSRRMSKEQEHV